MLHIPNGRASDPGYTHARAAPAQEVRKKTTRQRTGGSFCSDYYWWKEGTITRRRATSPSWSRGEPSERHKSRAAR